ncbi:hypothetical protein M409DRAFT_71530 [Zasmidium cellare ATCC 36951]|uniref:Aminoglycoside phosphotransferase domain-containing protein n=1 Tax=Zasmidium cellare ATCC 36951 TaxID=1080233 RepID=A0A6A6BVH4_ZASCE|nr:uncharacterized protein M409DRAFT_71530 [Zasmidium cellare ATCC 36951]KAF2158685.1 hypothetical protein M409DRAFT_71530 [Zasmidium cellare ATCC 36951]
MPLATKNASFDLDEGFFRRNGLKAADVERCLGVVRRRYPGWGFEGVRGQGGCSYTVLVRKRDRGGEGGGEVVVVQFRLLAHKIHEGIVRDVRNLWGELVPEMLWFEDVSVGEDVRLQVCGMSRVKGVAFGGVQPCGSELGEGELGRLRGLMGDLAGFFMRSWRKGDGYGRVRGKGKVGASIRERLVLLEGGLPRRWLRLRARSVRRGFDSGLLDCLPVVLNHGDLLPSNIMVDRGSWRLTGLVDWAEAEYLPFGMSLYGIEHLLGGFDHERQRFVYYDRANELRDAFWDRLRAEIPELRDQDIWKAVILSRTIGILLWHGIAWDEGRLDRVVDYVNDREELAYLESFLGGSCGSRESKL